MIYIVIGLVITVLVIVISSVNVGAHGHSSNREYKTPEKRPEPPFPPKKTYQITDLYEVSLDFKGTKIVIHDVKSSFKDETFMTFTTKDDEKVSYKIEDISYYFIEKSGTSIWSFKN